MIMMKSRVRSAAAQMAYRCVDTPAHLRYNIFFVVSNNKWTTGILIILVRCWVLFSRTGPKSTAKWNRESPSRSSSRGGHAADPPLPYGLHPNQIDPVESERCSSLYITLVLSFLHAVLELHQKDL
jgi:hypothetical protein